MALYADGVNVHAFLMPRAEFRKTVEGAVRNSFMHSLLAKGRLLYTHDRDDRRPVRAAAARSASATRSCSCCARRRSALPPIDKAHKWFVTRGDLDYTALWILYAATPLAQIEVIGARLLADREVIPQALKLNPAFFKTIYADLLNAKKTREERAGGARRDRRLPRRARAGAVRAGARAPARGGRGALGTEIEDHFTRNFDVERRHRRPASTWPTRA